MILKISKTLSWSAVGIILLSIFLLLLGYDRSNGAAQNYLKDSELTMSDETYSASAYENANNNNIVSENALKAEPIQLIVLSRN